MESTALPPGLTANEVALRIAAGQVNRTRREGLTEYLDIVVRNIVTLFNALVIPAAIALFLLGDTNAGLAVSGMALTNTLLGLAQEVRAKRHLDRLSLLAEARVRVRRDGQTVEVASGDVVAGDVILLAAGDGVVADGTLLESRFLEVDEALLTGESDPVARKIGEQLLSGSFAVAGEGAYRADRVGAEAFAQMTAAEARAYQRTPSPLQRGIDRLIRVLTTLAVLLCLSYLGLSWLRPDLSRADIVRMVAATITLLVPQGLVLMTTLAFILGAVRMTARGALVQRLEAVEAMASIDTLCMDKTGTLTTGGLALSRVVPLGGAGEADARSRLAAFASLSLDQGNKTLQALRAALGPVAGELLDQVPFKSQTRYSAVRVRTAEGERTLVLGAPEALRPLVEGTVEFPTLAAGLRVLLLAEPAPGAAPPRVAFEGSLEGYRLQPVCLVALSDELRPEAAGVLAGFAAGGVTFKILSGDNPETVRATVAPLAEGRSEPALLALADGPVVSGAELEQAPVPGELIRTRTVFGRVSPWQKVQVVTALKAQGHRVAMLGDGVNDVLPIKNANLGIAMGDGARATRTVAGLVLQTNDFALLPRVLDEGRTIVRNLRRVGKLILAKNAFVLVMIVLGVVALGLPFPLLPQQVTLLNFLTIGAPALLITLGREKTRAQRTEFVRDVGGFALRSGAGVGLAGLAVMAYAASAWPDEGALQKTVILATLVLLGVGTLLRALLDGPEGLLPGDRPLLALAGGALTLFVAAVYLPPTASFFELSPLTPPQWGLALGCALPVNLLLWGADHLLGARTK